MKRHTRLDHYTTGGAVICDAAAAAVRANRAGAAVGLPAQSTVSTGGSICEPRVDTGRRREKE